MQFAASRLSIHPIKTRQEEESLCTLFNRITFTHPVRPQIVGNVKHFQLRETQIMEGFVPGWDKNKSADCADDADE
jgi:hypothetical protein